MSVSEQELTKLALSHDIISIGMAADDVRRARHGRRTTFVRVAVVKAADAAADAAGTGAPGAATVDAAGAGAPGAATVAAAGAAGAAQTGAWPPGTGEIRLLDAPASRAAAVERVARAAAAAGGVPLSGFSLADLERLAPADGVTLRALLEELRAAGLELIAEAPFDQLQDPHRSIEEVNIAGLALARLTIHQSSSIDPLPVLKAVSDLQRKVAVIRAFAPLPRRANPAAPTTGYEDIKRVALARIVCDNVPSIQVDWALYGPKLAQVALTVGADDVDAVSPLDATTGGRRRAPLEEIRRNIRAAGQIPVERNGRFDPVPEC